MAPYMRREDGRGLCNILVWPLLWRSHRVGRLMVRVQQRDAEIQAWQLNSISSPATACEQPDGCSSQPPSPLNQCCFRP